MAQIKAIETRYNGYRFRSRLEARWAVFFDALGIEYEYEPQGFDLGSMGWYLPDFWLPTYGTFVEIKAGEPTQQELQKAWALSKDHSVWLIQGVPGLLPYGSEWPDDSAYWVRCPGGYEGAGQWSAQYWNDWTYEVFVQCRRCEYIGLEDRSTHFNYAASGSGYGICCTDRAGWATAPRLMAAYETARYCRFEHSETLRVRREG